MGQSRERAKWIAIVTSIMMVAQLVAGRAVRDALFLSHYDAALLPRVMLAASLLSLLFAFVMSRVTTARGPRTTALILALVNGILFVAEGALAGRAPGTVAAFAYIHISVLGALLVSGYASVINERFDPLYAKTVVAQVGTGGAFGGVLGGALALLFSGAADLRTVLFVIGGTNVAVGIGAWNIGASTQSSSTKGDDSGQGIQAIRKDRYLRTIALMVILLGAAGVFLDYAMKAEADARFDTAAELLSFFAAFYMAAALLTFAVQAGVAKKLLEKVGLAGTMLALPVAVVLSAGLGAVWTRLWTTALARGSQTVLSSSLFRSGYELLYTPVAPRKKRSTKPLIDVAFNRIGYATGSIVAMAIVALTESATDAAVWVLVLAVFVAIGAGLAIRQLHRGYVRQLATSLRNGSLTLNPDDIVDATTLQTHAAISRTELLGDIEAFRRQQEQTPAELLVMLGDNNQARAAEEALEAMGDGVLSELAAALCSETYAGSTRRRLPRLLARLGGPSAVEGLLGGLLDREFEVRYRCGRELVSLKQEEPSLTFPEATLVAAVEHQVALDDAEEAQGLQHVFTLLGMAFDRDAMILCHRALSSDDANLRGTALEYLYNVLPESILDPLWPQLTEQKERPPASGTAPQDLLKSMEALMLDRDQLKK